MSRDDAINIMGNTDLKKMAHYIFFSLYVKMSKTTYYQGNREVILKRANEFYENNKEALRKKKARDKYRIFPEEEKNTKREYRRNRYHNMSEEKEQRLKEFEKN